MALWSRKSRTGAPPMPAARRQLTPRLPVSDGRAARRPLQRRPRRPRPPPPSRRSIAEEAKKRAAVSKHLLLSFGEIVSVLMRSPQFRDMPLAEVEALVVPAVMSGQFLVAEAQSKSKGFVTPVATAMWATVSAEVDQRLAQDLDKPFRLQPDEWRSGDIAWLITIAGDGRIISPMLKQLQETTLKGQPLKMRVKGKDGKVTVGTFAPNAAQDAATQTA